MCEVLHWQKMLCYIGDSHILSLIFKVVISKGRLLFTFLLKNGNMKTV